MADLLRNLSEEDIEELAQAIADRNASRRKINYDTMNDTDRRLVNTTIHPMTHKTKHVEYPKMLYGMKADGILHSAEVRDAVQEEALRATYGDFNWKNTPGEHGVETMPSVGMGFSIRAFDVSSAQSSLQGGMESQAFARAAAEAVKRGPGRPRKVV